MDNWFQNTRTSQKERGIVCWRLLQSTASVKSFARAYTDKLFVGAMTTKTKKPRKFVGAYKTN